MFTEPSDVDPDTLANLGPLRPLAGRWRARKGVDLNPKADGPERRVFIENIDFQPIDPQTNGPQLLYGLRYHIHITTEEEDITFHEQVGYWLWEPATGMILQTVAIPRGQVALAAGHAQPDATEITVSGRARPHGRRHLLNRLPRAGVPNRRLPDHHHLPHRRQLELRHRH